MGQPSARDRGSPDRVPADSTRSVRLSLGDRGEELAAALLIRQGAQVLERNWRARPTVHGVRGELDLIVRLDAVLVAVEVKTRCGEGYGHPLESIDEAKLRRLHRLIAAWAASHGQTGRPRRVDAVSVVLLPRERGSQGEEVVQRVRLEHRRGLH